MKKEKGDRVTMMGATPSKKPKAKKNQQKQKIQLL
jgi:hypothetical protein